MWRSRSHTVPPALLAGAAGLVGQPVGADLRGAGGALERGAWRRWRVAVEAAHIGPARRIHDHGGEQAHLQLAVQAGLRVGQPGRARVRHPVAGAVPPREGGAGLGLDGVPIQRLPPLRGPRDADHPGAWPPGAMVRASHGWTQLACRAASR